MTQLKDFANKVFSSNQHISGKWNEPKLALYISKPKSVHCESKRIIILEIDDLVIVIVVDSCNGLLNKEPFLTHPVLTKTRLLLQLMSLHFTKSNGGR